MDQESTNLPAQIADALVSIPKGLTPGVIKALDRLVGASVDIPIAWLQQKKAKIDAQTESYKLVEASIAETVASGAGADSDIAQRAMNKLVRKEYRKQVNREAVASAMVEELRDQASSEENLAKGSVPASEVDDDWLNVFERYAEDEPPPLNWSVPVVRKTEKRRWELRDRSLKRLSRSYGKLRC